MNTSITEDESLDTFKATEASRTGVFVHYPDVLSLVPPTDLPNIRKEPARIKRNSLQIGNFPALLWLFEIIG